MTLGFISADDLHISLKGEGVFKVGNFVVTNSMLYGLVVAVAFTLFMVWMGRKVSKRPQKGLVAVVEVFVEFIHNMMRSTFNDESKARKYTPIFGVFFLFIFSTNSAGLLPLVGEGIAFGEIPAFRPVTADLNGTLAMALFAIITVQYLSIKESGLGGHLNHYFGGNAKNPINFFVGILEMFGELTRAFSLGMRLFVNTAAGEILVVVFLTLGIKIGLGGALGSITVLPIIIFELLVAGIQAYVFTVLSATYLALAITHHDDHHEDDHDSSNHSAVTPVGEVPAAGAVNG